METQSSDYQSREFMIFSVTELDQIDFTQVCETSIDTVRKSVDQTKTFVKWDGSTPDCVSNLTTKEGPGMEKNEKDAADKTQKWITVVNNIIGLFTSAIAATKLSKTQ